MTLLLRTLTGSRLYGTNRPDSDYDFYEVHDHCKPFHSAHGPSGDVTRWPLSLFMKIADKGGHNALQLFFVDHDWCEIDLLKDFRASYRANPWACYPRFSKVAEQYREKGTEKGDTYALMFDDWMDQIWKTGKFNPRWRENA